MRRRTAATLAACAWLVACGSSGPAVVTPPPNTGIDLLTVASPTCPVQRLGQLCERPISARVTVLRAGATVTTVQTGDDGKARVPLQPGTYTLQGQPASKAFPRAPAAVAVTVVTGAYAPVRLDYDTGIR
jgi:hypothetical protein